MRKMLVADLFCGAGGSSTGARNALKSLGLEMELVVLNHWPTAIETHTKNHPEARHYCQDIATLRPHLAVPEGYLDLLMASPSCTHHSVARGGRPTSDQQRSDPWHIITWFTELSVKRALIENVPEFLRWGPVGHTTKRPIKGKEGEYFRAWVANIERLGGTFDHRILNCADFGDATTRRRFFAPDPFRQAEDLLAGTLPREAPRRRAGSHSRLEALEAGSGDHRLGDQGPVYLQSQEAAQPKDAGEDLCRRTEVRLARAIPRHPAQPHGRTERRPAHPDGRGQWHAYRSRAAGHCERSEGQQGEVRRDDDPVPTLDTKGGVWLAEPFVLSTQNSGAPRSVDEPDINDHHRRGGRRQEAGVRAANARRALYPQPQRIGRRAR
jgi:DNA (cytosine-5)-methyltransferase 1